MTVTIGAIFAGIGGMERGLEMAGLGPVLFQVEIDPFCRAVLAKHYPNVDRSIVDVKEATASNTPPVDLLCGGFPCTDVSGAGKGAGLSGARSGLWYELFRLIKEKKPRFVAIENVASGKGKWLCSVRRDLHDAGYRSRAFAISAREVGAPHLRRRIFVIAALPDANGVDLWDRTEWVSGGRESAVRREGRSVLGDDREGLANANGARLEGANLAASSRPDAARRHAFPPRWGDEEGWRDWERGGGPLPGVRRVAHGLPAGMDESRADKRERRAREKIERDVAKARLHALGNACSPQQSEVVGRILRELSL